MSDMGFTPNLVAGGNISPYRFVKMDTSNAFTGLSGDSTAAAAAGNFPVGVTDGSLYQPSVLFGAATNYHAISGTTITLQPTNTVQVEAGSAITTGSLLMSDTTGRAITLATAGTTGNVSIGCYIALEAASAAGEIIRAFRIGTRVLVT